VVNPRVQMQQQLEQLQRRQGTGNRFLSLLSRSGKVLNGVQGTEIISVNFRGGKLDMDLTVADLQLLDKLKQQLAEGTGLAVEIQSATASSDKRVRSRLRIEDNRS
ncbi:MAG: GspL/Epsl periplasmic domain-containing protein, partial [Gammaproteobacteria bacterium]